MSNAFYSDTAPHEQLTGDHTCITTWFHLIESGEEIIPDECTFYMGGEGYRFKFDYFKGWIKKISWAETNQDDRLIFLARDGFFMFKINLKGKKVVRYVYRKIKVKNIIV